MKITQEPKFQPITIVLETEEEAEAIWEAVSYFAAHRQSYRETIFAIADWFSREAKI